MKKWIISILILTCCAIIIFMFWGSDKQDLGGNYYYLPKYEAIDVGYPGGAIIYKSPKKYLYKDIKIYGNVISVNSNKNFIIAIQETDSSNANEINSIIVKKRYLKYYIIAKETDSVYGPYGKEEYLQKRMELNIPQKLILKE
jgi:hypothetical protein